MVDGCIASVMIHILSIKFSLSITIKLCTVFSIVYVAVLRYILALFFGCGCFHFYCGLTVIVYGLFNSSITCKTSSSCSCSLTKETLKFLFFISCVYVCSLFSFSAMILQRIFVYCNSFFFKCPCTFVGFCFWCALFRFR